MGKMPRRHDINAGGERLPERFTRVENHEAYRAAFAEPTEEYLKMKKEAEERRAKLIEDTKASVSAGDRVLLFWNGIQIIRVDEIKDTGVRIGPHCYGWECVRKPSADFVAALDAEILRLGME